MPFENVLSLVGAILLALGGGSAIVFALVKYVGAIWASRILEQDRANLSREHELLIRRRNVYAKLVQSLRVFLHTADPITLEDRKAFLAAYDEAALWAAEKVIESVGVLPDMNNAMSSAPGSIAMDQCRQAYARCITEMRKDCGFPDTDYAHRVVSFW